MHRSEITTSFAVNFLKKLVFPVALWCVYHFSGGAMQLMQTLMYIQWLQSLVRTLPLSPNFESFFLLHATISLPFDSHLFNSDSGRL